MYNEKYYYELVIIKNFI